MRIGPKHGLPEGGGGGPAEKRAKTGELAETKAALAAAKRELARLQRCIRWKIQCSKCAGWCHTVDKCPIHNPNRNIPNSIVIRTIAIQPTFQAAVNQSVVFGIHLSDEAVYVPVLIERYRELGLVKSLIKKLMDIVGEFRLYRQGCKIADGEDTREPPETDGAGKVTTVQCLYELYKAKDVLKGWINGTKPVHTFNVTQTSGLTEDTEYRIETHEYGYGLMYKYFWEEASAEEEKEEEEEEPEMYRGWFTRPIDVCFFQGELHILDGGIWGYGELPVEAQDSMGISEIHTHKIYRISEGGQPRSDYKTSAGSQWIVAFDIDQSIPGNHFLLDVSPDEDDYKGVLIAEHDEGAAELTTTSDGGDTWIGRPKIHNPVDVCCDNGRLYVADGSVVKLFKNNFENIWNAEKEYGWDGHTISKVCLDAHGGEDGEPLVFALCGNAIRVFSTTTGEVVRTLRAPFVCGSIWVAPGPEGHLYVSPKRTGNMDTRDKKVAVLSKTDGKVVRTLATTGWVNAGCVGPKGRVYVAHDGAMDSDGHQMPECGSGGIDVFLPPLRR